MVLPKLLHQIYFELAQIIAHHAHRIVTLEKCCLNIKLDYYMKLQ